MSETLTDKQQVFIDQYFALGFNATQAAIKAGYSKKSAHSIGSENLRKPEIRGEIERRMTELAMGSDEVLARLAGHGRSDMRDFIGLSSRQLRNHPDGNLIKKYKRTFTTTYHPDGKSTTEERVEIELYDAQAALVQIGRHHQLFIDRTELTSGGKPMGLVVQGVMDGSDADALAEKIS